MENHNRNTELDRQLQEIAINNWEDFVRLIGKKNIMAAKICILRKKGNSYSQIANRIGTTRRIVQYQSGDCNCNITDQPSA